MNVFGGRRSQGDAPELFDEKREQIVASMAKLIDERGVFSEVGTNWEGVGVKPHLPTSSARALELAIKEALKSITSNDEQ